jgi:asparagine synthase (glutamine-hydrolysing)
MGSIAAILSKSGPPDTLAVQRMLSAAPHRGDVVNVRVFDNAVLGISHRADIVDAHMSCPGTLVAVFSGTLDNATALERELTAAGFRPSSSTPADITVAAFRAFGPDAPNRLRGVFSGIVTDGRQMWGFRDHVGFSPLFYAESARHFVAATEVKQVLAGGGMSREPDIDVLERIVYGRLRPD